MATVITFVKTAIKSKVLWIIVACLIGGFAIWKLFIQKTIGQQTFGKVTGNATSVTYNIRPIGCGGFWIRK